MHRCQCVCLWRRSFVIALVQETLVPVYLSGVCLSLHFCSVHSCGCASACSELVWVNLRSWRSSVIHRRRVPSLFVVVSVFLGGSVEVFCRHTSAHAGVIIPSCQQGLARLWCGGISQGSAFLGIFLGVLVHRDQCMLCAYIGRPLPLCLL